MSGKELVLKFKSGGWEVDRVVGSHHVLKKGTLTAIVPCHTNRDLKKGTEQALLKKLEQGRR